MVLGLEDGVVPDGSYYLIKPDTNAPSMLAG
jgi:hypothetical protein